MARTTLMICTMFTIDYECTQALDIRIAAVRAWMRETALSSSFTPNLLTMNSGCVFGTNLP